MNAPNFYGAAAPSSADLDALVQAVLGEMGGLWLPAGSANPTRYPGAIAATQMPAAGAAGSFLNSQKLEASSIYSITLDAACAAGLVLVPSELLAVGFEQVGAGVVTSGQIDLLVDGKLRLSLYPGAAAAARTPYAWALRMRLWPGQILSYLSSVKDAGGADIGDIVLSFYARAAHIPFDTKVRL